MTAVALTNAYQMLTLVWRRAVFHGVLLAGWVYAVWHILTVATLGKDALAYWTVDLTDLYRGAWGTLGFFPYSPAAALAAAPFAVLSWPLFLIAWGALMLAGLAWLADDIYRLAIFLAFPPVAWELATGNIHILLAVAIVVGFRWPAAWAFVLLTKVTPGIALVWFLVRREWRALGIALGATVIIASLSFVLLPEAWWAWSEVLSRGAGTQSLVPLWLRLPLAAAIVAWGGLTDRRWTVPVAALLALPAVWGIAYSMLVAVVVLRSRDSPSGCLAVHADRAAGEVARES